MKKKKPKIFTIFVCVGMVMLCVACNKISRGEEKQSKNIKIICEDTVFPMVNDLVRDYNLNNEFAVTVETVQRERAFNELDDSKVDVLIGYVDEDKKEIKNELLAYDGIGVIVNKSNIVSSISNQELKKIFTGNILNWKSLKGDSNEIVPVAFKDTSNLVQQQFDVQIKDTPVKEEMSKNTQYVSSVEEMKNFVAQNKNAIGFIPGQWYNENNKFLKLGGIKITTSSLKNELYSLRFPIKLYYSKEKEATLKELFKYFKSEDGKKIIRKYCIEAF